MKAKHLLFIFFVLSSSVSQAQTMTLKECIELGLENNLRLRSQSKDIKMADITCNDNRNKILPVIQAFGNVVDNLHRGTSVTDGSGISKLLGLDIPYMKNQGLQYTMQGGVQAQMPIYDQTIKTSISIAEKMKEISELSVEKAREDLMIQIAQLYYLAQTTQAQIQLTEKNIVSMEALLSITQALREQGMILGVDVKRVNINLSNLNVAKENALSMYEQQQNLLCYVLDLPQERRIDPVPLNYEKGHTPSAINGFLFEGKGISSDLPELQLFDKQTQLTELQKKQIKASYLPTVSLTGSLSWSNFTDKFEHYFQDHASNHWYNSTVLGIQVSMPLFDRHIRRNSLRKADVSMEKLALERESVAKQFMTQYLNGLNEWENCKRIVGSQLSNYYLAEDVYNVTANQYREGVSSMSVLLQDQMNMTSVQTAFVNAMYRYLLSEITLLKLTGQLDLLIK